MFLILVFQYFLLAFKFPEFIDIINQNNRYEVVFGIDSAHQTCIFHSQSLEEVNRALNIFGGVKKLKETDKVLFFIINFPSTSKKKILIFYSLIG